MSILDSFDTILPTLLFHGKNDRIISIAAAEFFGACSGGTFIALDGGHACFIDNTDTIKSAITNFLGGINNGSV
jgi:pimeloyl-ACP methyl ester carboxylesterase